MFQKLKVLSLFFKSLRSCQEAFEKSRKLLIKRILNRFLVSFYYNRDLKQKPEQQNCQKRTLYYSTSRIFFVHQAV